LTKPNTFRHNQPASVASLRRLFAFSGTPFGFPLESAFTFTGIPNSGEILTGEELTYKIGDRTSFTERCVVFPNFTNPGEFHINFDSYTL
jgi:hypothetical protein